MRDPVAEMPARLGWRKHYHGIIFDPDAPFATLSLTPIFPVCSDKLAENCIVWNLWSLMESVRRPGAYSILNCECGDPSDADIDERVLVSHPDSKTVVWELDIKGLRPTLDETFGDQEGFIRLVFASDQYELDVRAMLREVQQAHRTPLPVEELRDADGYAYLVGNYPECRVLPIERFAPTINGDCDLDEFAEMDADEVWTRSHIFSPGTVFEIGFFGTKLFRINGDMQNDWIGRWFSRWEALDTFRCWIDSVARRFALRIACDGADVQVSMGADPNEFVLLPNREMESCHRAGEAFAEALRRCLNESAPAPGVEVIYVRRDLPLP